MAATDEYFDLLPLDLDPATKAVTAPSGASKALLAELAALNNLHRSILTLEVSPQIPPPPIPVNPKRSAQITKLKDGGNDFYRKGKHGEALKMYHLGITMALSRPLWEPQGLLFANRAQAHMALQNWAEGAVDAEASVEAKRAGNAKAWWRRGKCLLEMGRLDEAHEWVGHGLEMEGEEQELLALQQEVVARLEKKSQREEAIKAGNEKA
ncbi:TPR-like protein [Apiospora sp. TS-2023a]